MKNSSGNERKSILGPFPAHVGLYGPWSVNPFVHLSGLFISRSPADHLVSLGLL